MKNILWVMLPLSAALALLSGRHTGTACADCSPLIQMPDLTALWTGSAKMKLPYPAPPPPDEWRTLKPDERLAHVKDRVQAPLAALLEKQGLRLGAPAFIRIFKETRELELWMQAGGKWQLFRTYPIAAMSGTLGPKLQEGDGQAPEGFYSVTPASLNPGSTFHLSFNIGYPNAYDQHHGRTGTFIMVHGNEVSIGCFAMTDPLIEEIYLIVDAALKKGQPEVPVHTFPFPLTDQRLAEFAEHPHAPFWRELQPGYTAFETQNAPPQVTLRDGRYRIRE
ncbi:hypothetical protein EI77_03342 [Prosthecobacter fusiformis]|uniref:L,D-TPase catalytic domain-containing protein n=1 Tax=Prosthecobacter fusiformis TaxID=48464 RepID=A0A4R7RNW9_9BACT|nr:murein L,D-transpeptidase family protein [Prosthecobacter fusiformis]TDU67141.1 hypothetical protein EI77_03342 [Prosthecobacter fusiformis]